MLATWLGVFHQWGILVLLPLLLDDSFRLRLPSSQNSHLSPHLWLISILLKTVQVPGYKTIVPQYPPPFFKTRTLNQIFVKQEKRVSTHFTAAVIREHAQSSWYLKGWRSSHSTHIPIIWNYLQKLFLIYYKCCEGQSNMSKEQKVCINYYRNINWFAEWIYGRGWLTVWKGLVIRS